MILTIDVGNTRIKIAGFQGKEMVFFSSIQTDLRKTKDEYAIFMQQVADLHHVDCSAFEGGMISCVVPSLSTAIQTAASYIFHCPVKIVGPGVKTGLNIKIENPQALGADFVCASVGALQKYQPPLMVVSLGSATTFCALDASGAFLGGSIMPGIEISLSALSERTAQLPSIDLCAPPKAICGRTSDCMNAGIVLGTAGAIDGMIERYEEELGYSLTVIATGGNTDAIVPFCKKKIEKENYLVLEGLAAIYQKNLKG